MRAWPGVLERERAEMTDLDRVLSYLLVPSQVTHHGASCCVSAKSWIRAFDRSAARSDGGWRPPTWIRQRYEWGPLRWPVSWCQIVDGDVLDCGALAGLATEVFRMRGDSASQIQLALHYPASVMAGWQSMWETAGTPADWISGRLCYHEATVVVQDGQAHIWDPTDTQWLEPGAASSGSFGRVVALKPSENAASLNGAIQWGTTELPVGGWTVVNGASLVRD